MPRHKEPREPRQMMEDERCVLFMIHKSTKGIFTMPMSVAIEGGSSTGHISPRHRSP